MISPLCSEHPPRHDVCFDSDCKCLCHLLKGGGPDAEHEDRPPGKPSPSYA